jgi:hypothetical protein
MKNPRFFESCISGVKEQPMRRQHVPDREGCNEKLLEIEADPAFQRMMVESDADIEAGRVITHTEVVKASQAKSGESKKRTE